MQTALHDSVAEIEAAIEKKRAVVEENVLRVQNELEKINIERNDVKAERAKIHDAGEIVVGDLDDVRAQRSAMEEARQQNTRPEGNWQMIFCCQSSGCLNGSTEAYEAIDENTVESLAEVSAK